MFLQCGLRSRLTKRCTFTHERRSRGVVEWYNALHTRCTANLPCVVYVGFQSAPPFHFVEYHSCRLSGGFHPWQKLDKRSPPFIVLEESAVYRSRLLGLAPGGYRVANAECRGGVVRERLPAYVKLVRRNRVHLATLEDFVRY